MSKPTNGKRGSWGSVDGVLPPIPVAPEVDTFENAYRLPQLRGTPRQIAWARNIRHQFLRETFSGIMEAVSGLDDPKPVFDRLDALRGQQDAKAWIEEHRPHVADPIGHLIAG